MDVIVMDVDLIDPSFQFLSGRND